MAKQTTPVVFSCSHSNTKFVTPQTAYLKFPCARCCLKRDSRAKSLITVYYDKELQRISASINHCNRGASGAEQRKLAYLYSNLDAVKEQRDRRLLAYSTAVGDIEKIKWGYGIDIDELNESIKKAEDYLWKYKNDEMEKRLKEYRSKVERLEKERNEKIEGVVRSMEAAW